MRICIGDNAIYNEDTYPYLPKKSEMVKKNGVWINFFLSQAHWCGVRSIYSRFDLNMLELNFCYLALCSLQVWKFENVFCSVQLAAFTYPILAFCDTKQYEPLEAASLTHMCTHMHAHTHACWKNIAEQVILSCFSYGWGVKFRHCFFYHSRTREWHWANIWVKLTFLPEELSRDKLVCITY